MDFTTGEWVGIGIGIFFGVAIYIYIILKIIYRQRISGIGMYLFYTFCVWMWIFSFIEPPQRKRKKLKMAGIKDGQIVLDAGCGIGRYTIPIARTVRKKGRVYALDNQPFHVAIIKTRARIAGLGNIHTILANVTNTGLKDKSIDTVFMSDAFHEYGDKHGALREANRILKPDGTLFIDEHEMRERKLLDIVATVGLFSLEEKEGKIYRFKKSGRGIEKTDSL
ncbi:MAG: class I SAM-dependent methyltransferase [Dehalococcoidia bacterium]|nr:class I SAM-dependent methyltransferase [Dehalococcoidia bacterium]